MLPYVQINNLPSTLEELERLLRFRFLEGGISRHPNGFLIDGKIKNKKPVSEWLDLLFYDCNHGNNASRQNGLSRIAALIQGLKEIEEYDINLLNYFRKHFRKCSGNTSWGLRFEIDIASSLIAKGIPFDLGKDLPGGDNKNGDFCVRDVSIECTTTHVNQKKFSDFLYKIEGAVRAKSKKPYCHERTAIFIDITNLFYNRALQETPITDVEFRSFLKELLLKYNFGSIVASLWFFNRQSEPIIFQNLFIREDGENASKELEEFLSDDFGLDGKLQPIGRFDALNGY